MEAKIYQKSAECYTRQKCRRWAVLGVRPIRAIELRDADCALSQQITVPLATAISIKHWQVACDTLQSKIALIETYTI